MERIKALNDDINHLFCQMLSLTPLGRIFQTDRGPSALGTRKHMCKGMEAPECLACLGNEDFGVLYTGLQMGPYAVLGVWLETGGTDK